LFFFGCKNTKNLGILQRLSTALTKSQRRDKDSVLRLLQCRQDVRSEQTVCDTQ